MKKIIFMQQYSYYHSRFSQGSTDYGAGMKFNLNEDGSKFMRVVCQIWMRSSEMNPGTMIGGEATSTATDIGNRRLRFLAMHKYLKIHDFNPFWDQQPNFY
jgi:hypothetical protein